MRQATPDRPHAEVLELLGRFRGGYSLAEAYCAHQLVHAAASAPFSTALPSTLFHASHFLLARLVQVALQFVYAGSLHPAFPSETCSV